MSSLARYSFSSRICRPFPATQAPVWSASCRVPILRTRCWVCGSTSSHTTTSRTRGRPRTLDTPPSLKISAVLSETQDRSSFSASPGPSCARPTNAFKEAFPQTRMTAITAVRMPRGETAKMKLSRMLIDSERYCLLNRSPKREINGAWIETGLLLGRP
ncbi:uncharacterized protein BO72DRAFT_64710 [Aspergillus fijiensis CBS 313.89]|uniref:Uncharacterized protein n=1 Tax=Aspergillus fijiensis CBS 313.89 TaxID=1448319 RepID=A0A8G1RTR3_9EURO|nr:uncharacterized protein BO72DRAFT_64710 [Aspergillus fijiensis CBS 313.89]RAK78582.1 hypothetical protein BO72DRAFT_64710 [Aspergillus fijiensis CBS 313.89]